MTDTGWVILISYTIIAALGLIVLLSVFRSTRVGFRAAASEREVIESRENKWAVIVGIFLLVVLIITIIQVPYFKDDARADQRMQITGRQFAWTVSPARVQPGVIVADVRSVDVAHGVGIYDPDGKMIKQVNVSPGVVQRMKVKIEKPGTYSVLCMEFCGVDHHRMKNTFEVTRQP